MDAEAFPDRSLAESFLRGQEAVHWLESTHEPSVSEVYQAKVQDALECFRAASQLVRRLSIFSTNETAEDINTTDLKFLLSEFYLAQCELKVTGEDRATHVRRAQVLQDLFLANCERVGLLSAQDLEELRAGVDAPVDRTTKIERYKRERAAKQRLEELIEIQRRQQERGEGAVDDDVERERVLLLLQLSVRKALDDTKLIHQELAMLNHMNELQAAGEPLRPEHPAEGRGLSLTHIAPDFSVRREVYKAQVFRPGHRLPTMSLEEFAEREVAEAKAREERERAAPRVLRSKELAEAGEDDDEALADAAVEKDRAWDDWRDDHPKGIGNTKRI